MKKVIIDTNFLMIPYKFRVDIFSEINRICNFNYKLFIMENTVEELKSIVKNQAGRDKKAAQFALKLIGLKNIETIASKENDVDSAILSMAGKDTVVATLDGFLKNQLFEKEASVIVLRQKKYLQYFEGKAG
ncbi:hypothetical protein HY487_01680 [Candidatus Woesearchaeota archaeon]|nr:hypothetical protein [Candidatus Woesearchaeota archaeon]